MAVTWDVKINVVNFAAKRVSIVYTRTDDVLGTVWTSTAYEGIVDTANLAAYRAAQTNKAWADYSAYAAQQAQIASVVPDWETALEADIAAKEL